MNKVLLDVESTRGRGCMRRHGFTVHYFTWHVGYGRRQNRGVGRNRTL